MAYINTTNNQKSTQNDKNAQFIAKIRGEFGKLDSEVAQRNQNITKRDGYIYGEFLENSLDIPIGHDFTPVNWLRRTVEIHKNMFMSRGFQVISTYDSADLDNAADVSDRQRLDIENKKQKEYAEQRMKLVEAIQRDNGGAAFWAALAENASAVGDAAVKMYYDEDEEKIELCEIESVDNLYVLWNKDDFRRFDAVAYVYQVSRQDAIGDYGADEDVTTSPMGSPFSVLGNVSPQTIQSGQPMVTVMEVTGRIEGWAIKDGKCVEVPIGQETEFNCLVIGDKITRLLTEENKLPRYYIFHNKRQRRRPWGMSDVSDAAIQINQTYIETLSDWRTHASKVNFQKYKAYGFSAATQMPKSEKREVQFIPLSEEQDLQRLEQGDSNGLDFGRQMDELKEQFVRETGISRVLFDDPSITLNSNQALLTSMKPTSDIAEAKKQLWAPTIAEMFTDALEMVAAYKPEIADLVGEDSNWSLKVMWPSVMQKEDPLYQSMLLNRFNAGTMSLQSYLEAQGESKEEIDRLRDELSDPITAAVLGKQLPRIAEVIINAATAEIQAWFQSQMPQEQPAQPSGQPPGVNPNGGGAAQVMPDNQATGGMGMNPVSQPGTGATAASPPGAIAQANQNAGG